MRHDPERMAAAYLGGELTRRRRERYESHMLGCDDCWREVTAARRGRTLAETLRETAPQRTRERIRALAAAGPGEGPRRWPGVGLPLLVTGVVLMVLVVFGGVVLLRGDPDRAGQPAPLTAAVAAYRDPGGGWSGTVAAPPTARIGVMTWRGAADRDLGGQPATLYLYAHGAGHRLLVVRSPQPFPDAEHVEHVDGGPAWVATVGDAAVFCADRRGSSWLAIGDTRDEVLAAGRVLGLR